MTRRHTAFLCYPSAINRRYSLFNVGFCPIATETPTRRNEDHPAQVNSPLEQAAAGRAVGVAQGPCQLELPKRSPSSFSLPDVRRPPWSCRSAVCCSAATASPPVRATRHQSTASQGRAGGRVWRRWRARLGLDRRAPLGEPHGGSVSKRLKMGDLCFSRTITSCYSTDGTGSKR